MNFVAFFIKRPVATTLLTVAIALPGIFAFKLLPISALPQIDMPTIEVRASLPGASPETMASTVATPLERAIGTIAGITEMTSQSNKANTRINVQFDLDRDPDGAARDVFSAINAAKSLLPANLPTNPTYRKTNTSGGPIMVLSLTSNIQTQQQLYDVAFTVLGQRLSQVNGVGQVLVNGSSLRSVRVEINPNVLGQYHISLETVSSALANANVNQPKGFIQSAKHIWQIDTNDQAGKAVDYENLIVSWQNEAPIRLKDIAAVIDSVQEVRNAGSANGQPAVMLNVYSQPGANVVETVDAVKKILPGLKLLIPANTHMETIFDRSATVRKSLQEVEHTLLISIALVILVTFAFLKNVRATLIPTIAIPVSLLGTLSLIYLCGFSLNNLSLMAIIIATGFVVDDAIVVVENISRHLEAGSSPFRAAIDGLKEVSFTVVAMSVSLLAVFIPLLLMGGVVGRIFREFSVTLAIAVIISLVVSLITTPMLCAHLLKPHAKKEPSDFSKKLTLIFEQPFVLYKTSLHWALNHGLLMLVLLLITVALNVYLYMIVPKGLFPQQDTGRIQGAFQGDQNISFKAMRGKIDQLMKIVSKEEDIDAYFEFSGGAGGGQSNAGNMFARLKPKEERSASAQEIVAKLRPKLNAIPGVSLRLTPQQELNIGARGGSAQFQFTLLSSDLYDLRKFTPVFRDAMNKIPLITDVTSDAQDQGLQTTLQIDRDAAANYGISQREIDSTLNDAFGQRLVSTIYEPLNQYYVVLTLAPQFATSPESLNQIHLITADGRKVPLSAISHWQTINAALSVNHQDQFPASTISFNLAPDVSLSDASQKIESTFESLNPPDTIRGEFAGSAKTFKDSLKSQPWLILTALIAVYIVLGILYESTIHPLTIISTLPSAGIGALLALLAFKTELTIIAFIGIILLTGIVMKNAIMMINAAIHFEREAGKSTQEAIYLACLQRFRPIIMTTLAAMFGALPLALGAGDGAEIRTPLGIAIVGGLLFSQVLTLYTTPVVYLYLDKLRLWLNKQATQFKQHRYLQH
jgi:hydrophobe/amphiphile efflux-1 (HAE1) family protein